MDRWNAVWIVRDSLESGTILARRTVSAGKATRDDVEMLAYHSRTIDHIASEVGIDRETLVAEANGSEWGGPII
jgi:hypothetical protein